MEQRNVLRGTAERPSGSVEPRNAFMEQRNGLQRTAEPRNALVRARRLIPALAVLLLALGAARPAAATEQPVFGPQQYTRTAGPPNQFTDNFPLPPTLAAPFRLHVQNGNPDGSNRISSATITLNGTQAAGPSDFNQQVAGFDRTVSLQANNTLQVRLTSPPGSFLVVTLYGTVPPPTVTSLLPPALPITQGGTGTLTATISAAQAAPTAIALSSDIPGVAAVPATATVPAGQLTVAIPVTAVADAVARVQATMTMTFSRRTEIPIALASSSLMDRTFIRQRSRTSRMTPKAISGTE